MECTRGGLGGVKWKGGEFDFSHLSYCVGENHKSFILSKIQGLCEIFAL